MFTTFQTRYLASRHMSSRSISCPKCGKQYLLSDDFPSRTVRCRACQTSFSVDVKDEPELPELPKITRRKLPKRRDEIDDTVETYSSGKRKRSISRPRNYGSSPFLLATVITLIYWAFLGLVALVFDWKWGLVGLVPNALVFLVWGMAGISLVAQEENETHGMICWSALLLLLTPVIPCVTFISLIGLILILFYGLSRLEKTAWYVLMIILAIGMLTTVGTIASRVPF